MDADRILNRWGALKTERAPWIQHWRDISEYLQPRTGRWLASDRNKGERKYNSILNSTGTRALNVLAAGMMSGLTSPARPWFRLSTSDPQLDEAHAVKEWLADCGREMMRVFARSNIYRALHSAYEEQGAYGTWSGILVPREDAILHCHPLTAGEYALATDHFGVVSTLYREFDMTAAQVVGEFGKEAVSPTVRRLVDQGQLDTAVRITHAIEPRTDRDRTKRDTQNKAFRSVYFETGADKGKYLREAGFDSFPGLCPRWTVTSNDTYGRSPAMEALGDVRQLQSMEFRKAQIIHQMSDPALQAPSSLKSAEIDTLPGGITFVDTNGPNGGIRPLVPHVADISAILGDIQNVESRIKQAFYSDLFLMLAGDDHQMTATEVAERREEKMLMMGPVLERQDNELLTPLIERTFQMMFEAGRVPPTPPELDGVNLQVEFVSVLAQAQRAAATQGIDRFVANIGAVAQFKPDVLDRFNADTWADAYADKLGVDPELIVPTEKAALIRQQRAQAQQQAAAAEQAQTMATAMQKFGQTPTTGDNAAASLMRQLTGY